MCRLPGNEELRRRWGCDGPAEQPVFHTSCPRCGVGEPSCSACAGTGRVGVFRCPTKAAEGTWEFREAALYLEQHGVLPAEGGLSDQAAWLVDGLHVWDSERAAIEKRRRDAEDDARGI